MPWCYECKKSYDGDLELCPECGALFEAEEECAGDCVSCGSTCDNEHEHEHEESCDTGLWPSDDDGKPVKPARLTTVMGSQVDYEMTISFLQAFGIPTVRDYPGSGQLVKILFGFTGTGMDVYVPENMLEIAKELLADQPDAVSDNSET